MYTSCPECGTVFRISTIELRAAEGYVRCGHCSATFNAVATLSDEPSATVTLTQLQLAEGPAPEEARPSSELPPVEEATGADDSADDARDVIDALGDISEDTLEFDIPEDNWSHFFENVFEGETRSRTGSEPAPAAPIALAPESASPAGNDADAVDEVDVGEAIGSDTVDQAGLHRALTEEQMRVSGGEPVAASEPEPEPEPESEAAADTEIATDSDWEALLDEVRDDDIESEPVYVIGEMTDEDALEAIDELVIPGTAWDEPDAGNSLATAPLPADFAPDIPREDQADADETPPTPAPAEPESVADQPFLWTPPVAPPAKPERHWGYVAGSMAAGILLILQLLHYQRDELATNPRLAEPLKRSYAALGLQLFPAWKLSSYEVRNSEAVADRSDVGALDILARIAVVGSEPVGLPLVRVTLRDRSGKPVGTRVFEPSEYLGRNSPPREPMAPGTIIPVEISLEDPGPDAQGFDVDVCLMSRQYGITCRGKLEPFAR